MFEEKSIREVTAHFQTNPDSGLSTAEASGRLASGKRNELEQEKKKTKILYIIYSNSYCFTVFISMGIPK